MLSDRDVTPSVLLPGDPGRVKAVAAHLDDWRELAYNREFRSGRGLYKNLPVTVLSTGIGGASMAIALEELINCGSKDFIRIGSAGASQSHIGIGDLIISTAAVREDGASAMYAFPGYPATADHRLVSALATSCADLKYRFHLGITRSHDSFYIDDEREKMALAHKMNVLGSDMETAALYTIASLRGVRAASVLNNVVLYEGDVKEGISSYAGESEKDAAEGEEKEIIAALEALLLIS